MSDDPVVDALLEALDEATTSLRLVAVKCVQVSPLLVSIAGIGSVPAIQQGITMALDDVAYALWSPPTKPIVLGGVGGGTGSWDPAGTAAGLVGTEVTNRINGDTSTLVRSIAISIALGG